VSVPETRFALSLTGVGLKAALTDSFRVGWIVQATAGHPAPSFRGRAAKANGQPVRKSQWSLRGEFVLVEQAALDNGEPPNLVAGHQLECLVEAVVGLETDEVARVDVLY
jgi:hypothetical protein